MASTSSAPDSIDAKLAVSGEGESGEEEEQEEEEEDFFDGSSILKSNVHRRDSTPFLEPDAPSNRFSIRAERFKEEEEDGDGGEEEEASKEEEEALQGAKSMEEVKEIQNKRMSIRLSVKKAFTSQHRICYFMREASTIGSSFYPQYSMYSESNVMLIAARKLTPKRASSYYLFDMSILKDVNKCVRSSKNIIGKLVKKKTVDSHALVLQRDEEEFGAILFNLQNAQNDTITGAHPRVLTAAVPLLDAIGHTIPHNTKESNSSLVDVLHKKISSSSNEEKSDGVVMLKTKEPIFYNGCYRLHFLGKSPIIPSIKNFQVIDVRYLP